MKIKVLWTRTYSYETETVIEVPDGITQKKADEAVRKALIRRGSGTANVSSTGFVRWDEVDDDEEKVDNGLRGEIDE